MQMTCLVEYCYTVIKKKTKLGKECNCRVCNYSGLWAPMSHNFIYALLSSRIRGKEITI